MVDITTLQAWGYVFGYISVGIAALSFALNQRASQRNMKQTLETRKLSFVTSLTNQLNSEEGHRRFIELLNMEWKDYDDFERKYGSDNNPDNFAKRMSVWNIYNTLGMLVREKLVDAEAIYNVDTGSATFIWSKFKDIMPEWKKRYGSKDLLSDFEFLYNEYLRIMLSRDPSYKEPETLSKYVPDK